MKIVWIFILGVAVSIIGYNLWPYAWHGFFYHANAIAFCLTFWCIKQTSQWAPKKKTKKWLGCAATIAFWFSINNLIDELLFNPTLIGINEYIFAVIVIISVIRNHVRSRRN